MSFQLTTKQIKERTKTVTRRLGWSFLKAGDRINACEKCMGLKKGEKVKKLAVLEVVTVEREPLAEMISNPMRPYGQGNYWESEARREGFPGMNAAEFVKMFCDHMRCTPETIVTRIEFRYV